MSRERSVFLFDLDGTLTDISDEEFARKYFNLIAEHSSGAFDMMDFLRAIKLALDRLASERDGRTNNYELFMQTFASSMPNHSTDYYKDFFTDFYDSSYDDLRSIVLPNERITNTLVALNDAGFPLVLATNPIFPSKAINKRLSWIGLAPELFNHITTMENSHYVKPQEEYFLEAASSVSASPEECIMVGNDPVLDGASSDAGIMFIHVEDLKTLEKLMK